MAAALAVAAVLSVPVVLAQPTDQAAIARRLVAAAGLHEGDLVMVWGGTRDFALLEELVLQARASGAETILTLTSQKIERDGYTKVPERFDSRPPVLWLKMADTITALFSVDADIDPSIYADISPARRAARSEAGNVVGQRLRDRKVRIVNLGNGLYPNDANARLYGIPRAELERVFWAAVAVEPARLEAGAAAIRKALESGRELRITHPNGTDLRMSVAGRKVIVSDGAISAEEAKLGGISSTVALPAGEVMVTPVPGTAVGRVVGAPDTAVGKELLDWTLTFEKGRLVSMTGRGGGFAPLKARYEAAGSGKDVFAFVDFGINPALQLPANVRQQNTMPAGMVTVWFGDNSWLGAENDCAYGNWTALPGATVTVDGKPIVEKGVLK
jgi:leucyl aminopeptidase (aminopeptidase T)